MGLEPKTGAHNWQGEEDSLKSHSDHGKCQRMKRSAEAQAVAQAEALAALQLNVQVAAFATRTLVAAVLGAATVATEATAVAKF